MCLVMKTDMKSYTASIRQKIKVGSKPMEAPRIAPAEETESIVHKFLFTVLGFLFVQNSRKTVKAIEMCNGKKKSKVSEIKKKAAKFSI